VTILMCNLSWSIHRVINEIERVSMAFFTILLIFMLSGCQLLDDSSHKKPDFSHYYLWIKSLNDDEVKKEIVKQKSNIKSGYTQADVQLIMLYSLPNSPIHNPYTAKSMLNDYPLIPYTETTFSATDLAFIVMLKDQLNQQLLLLEKITNYKGVYKQAKKLNTAQQLQINKLNNQIIQLKKIEKIISNRGQ